MKNTRAILGLALLAVVASLAATPARAEVSFGFFYSNLEPHGAWHVSAQYGNVWQPAVYAPGWNPYYDGHWVYADVGWMWVSDYHWGAIPYHYGTWALDPYYGWVWVPGYTWAPAWVTYRTSPGYIGWAPVAPGFSVGVSFASAAPSSQAYVYVPTRAFAAPHIRGVAVPATRGRALYRETTVVRNLSVDHNVVVNRGLDVRHVERASGHPVQRLKVEQVAYAAPFRDVTRSQLAVDRRRGIRATSSVDTLRNEARRSAPQVAAARPRAERNTRLERPSPPARESMRSAPQVRAARPRAERDTRLEQPEAPARESTRSAPQVAAARPRADRDTPLERPEAPARQELRFSQPTDRRTASQMERPSKQRPTRKQQGPKPNKH